MKYRLAPNVDKQALSPHLCSQLFLRTLTDVHGMWALAISLLQPFNNTCQYQKFQSRTVAKEVLEEQRASCQVEMGERQWVGYSRLYPAYNATKGCHIRRYTWDPNLG